MARRALLALALAAALAVALAAVASAATITAENPDQLRYIVYHANTTYSIAVQGDKIAVTNTDANNTLLLVFNPALAVSLFNVSGANAVIVNTTNYAIIEHVLGNTTSYEVVGYAGEGGADTALGLLIPPNSTAVIGAVYYAARAEARFMGLAAIAPPEGYKLAGDKYGTDSEVWAWQPEKDGSLWVAFYQGDASDTSNPSDLYIYSYTESYGGGTGAYGAKLALHLKKVMYGKNGAYETATLTVSKVETITFSVKTYAEEWKTAWRVIYAFKPDTKTVTKIETPAATMPDNTDNHSTDNGKLAVYAAAGAAFLALIALVTAASRRR